MKKIYYGRAVYDKKEINADVAAAAGAVLINLM